jgi:uncharacterized protein YkvS
MEEFNNMKFMKSFSIVLLLVMLVGVFANTAFASELSSSRTQKFIKPNNMFLGLSHQNTNLTFSAIQDNKSIASDQSAHFLPYWGSNIIKKVIPHKGKAEWGPIELSTIYPGLRGTIEKVELTQNSINPKIDSVIITEVEPKLNLQEGVETDITIEVEYNLATMKNAILSICFNIGGNHGETSENAMELAIWEVPKGQGKYVFTIPVVPKRWEDGSPFWVLGKLRKINGELIYNTQGISLGLMTRVIDISTIYPGLRGTIEKLNDQTVEVNPSIDNVVITKVEPNENLQEGVETYITIEVEYNLISMDKAILDICFNTGGIHGETSENAMESSIWEVSMGQGKYRFIIPVVPKRWEDGSPFWVLSGLRGTDGSWIYNTPYENLALN